MKKTLAILCGLIGLTFVSTWAQENTILIKTQDGNDTISKHIYGHFAEHLGRCIYDGIWVGEDSSIPNINGYRKDVVDALRELEIPNLRWPGGCFADTYHWKDGIGPKEDRPKLVNIFWGDVIEDNSFGTHEFLNLCEMLDTEPYIAVNVGSGTPREAYEWIEYVTSDKDSPMANLRRENGREEPWDVKYWGIGNENWGCGGNMTASYYTDLFKRFATFTRGEYQIASGGLNHDLDWTETLMRKTEPYQNLIDGMSYHHYTVAHTWAEKGSATDFDETDWALTISKNIQMEENLEKHIEIMDKYDPDNSVALIADEWGNWHDPDPGTNPKFLYQQNTLRDAVTASIYLNIFNKHAKRVRMANIAQTVNVLQAMLLTNDEEVIKTPTFYVFKMYKKHYDALYLPAEVNCADYTQDSISVPALSVSASKNKQDEINITIANVDPENDMDTEISLDGIENFDIINSEIITADNMRAYNDFGEQEKVTLKEYSDVSKNNKTIQLNIPSKSVILVSISEK